VSFDTVEIAIVASAAAMVPVASTGGVRLTPPVMLLPAARVVEGVHQSWQQCIFCSADGEPSTVLQWCPREDCSSSPTGLNTGGGGM
jgi:hypothetical protein